jgi:hypothetical protein
MAGNAGIRRSILYFTMLLPEHDGRRLGSSDNPSWERVA